jgi:hypothetical protein
MRARIRGAIAVECVVQTSGMCTDIRVNDHSIRRSVSIRKRSRPRRSGVSVQARSAVKQYQ